MSIGSRYGATDEQLSNEGAEESRENQGYGSGSGVGA